MKRVNHISRTFTLSFIILLLCISVSTLIAQVPEQLEITTYTISADVDLLSESLQNVEVFTAGESVKITHVLLNLVQGELHIKYTLDDNTPDEQRNGTYDVYATILVDDIPLQIRPDKILGDYGEGIITEHGLEREFVVTDLIEDYINLAGKLIIQLNVTHSYDVVLDFEFNCDVEPAFTTGQRVPYLIGGVVGVGLVAWGGVMEGNAQDKYDQYKRLINDNKTLYDDANRDHKTAQALMIAGGVVLVTDVVLYVIRSKKYKKRKKMYDKYCAKKISFRPVIDLPGVATPSGSVGLALHYTFK